jgi:L-asparaginase II
MEISVAETRGKAVENMHAASLAISGIADCERPVFIRSCAKPFQASFLQDDPHLSLPLLAVASASHTGTPVHLEAVRQLLAMADAVPADLNCGSHPPTDANARHALIREGAAPCPLHHNCSGKHAGMLLQCRQAGWPMAHYEQADHPLQQRLLEWFKTQTQQPDLLTAVDGCSVPTFFLPLNQLAYLYAQLADSAAFSRIRQAWQLHPELMGGPGRIDTRVIQASGGQILAKVGADGVMAASRLSTGQGFALKVWSGSEPIRNALFIRLLHQFNWLPDAVAACLSAEFSGDRRNAQGHRIGELRIESAQYQFPS